MNCSACYIPIDRSFILFRSTGVPPVQIQEIASFLQARRADTALAGGDSHRMGFANYPPLPSKRVFHDLDD
jgi:hypothetical protein